MEPKRGQTQWGGSDEPGATQYSGPVVVTTHVLGGRTIRLVRPTDPDRLLDDPGVIAWNRRDDYMPYWAYVWPGSYLLADAVIREPWPLVEGSAPLEALEIGCGLGLAGMFALAAGLRVQFSDYDWAPLEFVARGVAANGFDPSHCVFRRLDWRDPPNEQFPIILGSDVIYETRLVPLVANVLSKLLAPGGMGLIATPYRLSAEGFPAALALLGLNCQAEPATVQDPDGELVRGTVYRVTWADKSARTFGSNSWPAR
jgi:predicted nicotinamide N-methyase